MKIECTLKYLVRGMTLIHPEQGGPFDEVVSFLREKGAIDEFVYKNMNCVRYNRTAEWIDGEAVIPDDLKGCPYQTI